VAEPRDQRSQPGWPEVVALAAVVVAAVLGAGVITGLLPAPLQDLVYQTPLAIAGLIAGTGWLLWRISRRDPQAPDR
jgi:hypothetical protein